MKNYLLDILFDGITNKTITNTVNRFYTDEWANGSINTVDLINPPEFIKKWIDYEKIEYPSSDGESVFGLTISHYDDKIRCTVDFYKTNFNPNSIMDFILNNDDFNDEIDYFSWNGVCIKRTYCYLLTDEKSAKKVNSSLKKHIQWYNDNCVTIFNMLRQMDMLEIKKNQKALDAEIAAAEQKKTNYIQKATKSISMICDAYKDMK